jgi:hypothetical protein
LLQGDYTRLSRKFVPALWLPVLVDEVLPERAADPEIGGKDEETTRPQGHEAADKLDKPKGEGHNAGYTELFNGLSGIQNWKLKYGGRNRISA